MPGAQGLYSCNYCEGKFPSQPDIETHLQVYHTEKLGNKTMDDERIEVSMVVEVTNVDAVRQRIPHSERQEIGRKYEEKDPEDVFSPKDEDDEDEEENNEYEEMMYHLRTLREAAVPLNKKITTQKASGQKMKYWPELSQEVHHLSGTAWFQAQEDNVRRIQGSLKNMRSTISEFALWNSLLKTVEGRFGGGVFNFFKFLKWSMALNLTMFVLMFLIIVPEFWNEKENAHCNSLDRYGNGSLWYPKNNATNCCSAAYGDLINMKKEPLSIRTNNAKSFFGDLGTVLANLVQGDGWMEGTYLYYGAYSDDNTGVYQTAVAYFFVIFSCFVVSLLSVVRSSAKSLRQNFKWNQFNSSQYFDIVFCTWDFSLDSQETVTIKQLGIVNEIKTALRTDEIQEKMNEKTRVGKALLQFKRIFLWSVVLLVLGGGATLLYLLYLEIEEKGISDECPSFDSLDSFVENGSTIIKCYFYQYATTITITSANLLLPFIFSYIIEYEEYNPKTKMIVDITRSIMIRLAGLVVMMGSLLSKNKCSYASEGDWTICSNQNVTGVCQRKMCWETSVGIEFYKLTVFDVFIQIAVVLLMDIPRVKLPCFKSIPAISTIEFNIPKHVLDIVYSQTICWMGLFFAPLLSIVTFIKLLFIFYLRIWYLKYLCTPSKSLYEASRTSSLLKIFLLVSFVSAFIPLAYIIGLHVPSNACGPFRGKEPNFYTGVVGDLIRDWESKTGQDIILFFGREEVLIITSAVLSLLTYYQWMRGSAQSAYNARIEAELKSVAEEKRRLTAELAGAKEGLNHNSRD